MAKIGAHISARPPDSPAGPDFDARPDSCP